MVLIQDRAGLCLTIIPSLRSYERGSVLLVFWFSIEMKMVLVVLATLLCCVLCGVFRMSVNTTCSYKCLLARLRLSACMKCVGQEECAHRDRYG